MNSKSFDKNFKEILGNKVYVRAGLEDKNIAEMTVLEIVDLFRSYNFTDQQGNNLIYCQHFLDLLKPFYGDKKMTDTKQKIVS